MYSWRWLEKLLNSKKGLGKIEKQKFLYWKESHEDIVNMTYKLFNKTIFKTYFFSVQKAEEI